MVGLQLSIALDCVLLFLTASCIQANNKVWEEDIGNVTLRFEKGGIRVSNSVNSIIVAFDRLYEVGTDGATRVGEKSDLKHRFHNFDFESYQFSNVEMIEVGGRDLINNVDRNITASR